MDAIFSKKSSELNVFLEEKIKILEEEILENNRKKCKEEIEDEEEKQKEPLSPEEAEAAIINILKPSIPYSAQVWSGWTENNFWPINNEHEISQTIPSKLLLNRNGLALKVVQELIMTNYWNGGQANYGLWASWAMNDVGYSKKGNWGVNNRLFPVTQIADNENQSIIFTKQLLDSRNQLYFDQVYQIIEKLLNRQGVNCTLEKAVVAIKKGNQYDTKKVLVSFGSLPFYNIEKINQNSTPNSLYYYLQVNFDIIMRNSNKVYQIRGFIMLLSDELDFYYNKK